MRPRVPRVGRNTGARNQTEDGKIGHGELRLTHALPLTSVMSSSVSSVEQTLGQWRSAHDRWSQSTHQTEAGQ